MKIFFSQLNPRQLIIYFVATWLLIFAAHTLTSLYDYSFLYKAFALQNRRMFKPRFSQDMFIIHTGGYLGLIAAYVISWQISVKQKWFWANAVLVFLVAFGLYYFDWLGWQKVKPIFLFPGQIFAEVNSLAAVITNGIVMLAAGLFLFFSKRIIRFIDRSVMREKKPPVPRVPKAVIKANKKTA